MPGAPSSLLFLVVRPGAPSSVLAPSSREAYIISLFVSGRISKAMMTQQVWQGTKVIVALNLDWAITLKVINLLDALAE